MGRYEWGIGKAVKVFIHWVRQRKKDGAYWKYYFGKIFLAFLGVEEQKLLEWLELIYRLDKSGRTNFDRLFL